MDKNKDKERLSQNFSVNLNKSSVNLNGFSANFYSVVTEIVMGEYPENQRRG